MSSSNSFICDAFAVLIVVGVTVDVVVVEDVVVAVDVVFSAGVSVLISDSNASSTGSTMSLVLVIESKNVLGLRLHF